MNAAPARFLLRSAIVLTAGAALLAPFASEAADPPAENLTPPGVTMNEAEKAFSDAVTGATLTGRFTVDGSDETPKEERYEIVAATKTAEHDWVIVARIQYGPNDVRVPVPVKMRWADDTPVLCMTDMAVPGLGTFTSRVMFYEGRYAGTWQHGDKGGHLFGTYSKGEPKKGGAGGGGATAEPRK